MIPLPTPPTFDHDFVDGKGLAQYWQKWFQLLQKAVFLIWTNPTIPSFPYAQLPTPATGMMAVVTNSNTAVWGASITGTGANKVLAWYNGSNWRVIGV